MNRLIIWVYVDKGEEVNVRKFTKKMDPTWESSPNKWDSKTW